MSVNRSTHNISDITDRVHLGTAAKYRPVAINNESANRRKFSESPMEAVRILPNTSTLSDSPGYAYINGKHPARARKRGLDNDTSHGNSVQSRERRSPMQSAIPTTTPFDWISYLKEIGATIAPASYFTHVPLDIRNDCLSVRSCSHTPLSSSFRPNQCMEGIDPHHESLFCALKVAEVVGRRLRLRFIGYPEKYDFWATVDSPFLFPVGWCAQNKRRLQPPKLFSELGQTQFDWNTFLAKENLIAVPRHLFRVPWDCPPNDSPNHMFRVGHKLEAVDKRNPGVVCVATVKDTIGDYVLIHFDGWNSNFDQWAHITSDLLHPVGYCEEQELVLSVPAEWNSRPAGFTWKQYLKETNSKPVPKEAFERLTKLSVSSPQLQLGHRLEAVDKRCPQLIRVANVVSLSPSGFVTIGFDGWSEKYNIRLECGSLDLFPAGYCQATGHPLQLPLRYEMDSEVNGNAIDAQSNSSTSSTIGASVCPTVGCKGFGHVKGPRFFTHQRASGCPYSDMNLNRDFIRPHERLAGTEVTSPTPDSTMPKLEQAHTIRHDGDTNPDAPGLSPDSSVKSEPTNASKQIVSSPSTNCMPTAQSVTSSRVHATTINGNAPPGLSSPSTSTVASAYDVASLSLTCDQVTKNGTASHSMPLDLSVFGKDKLKDSSGVSAVGPKNARRTDDTVSVESMATTATTTNPMNTQAMDTTGGTSTESIESRHTHAPPAQFLDISTQPVVGTKRPANSSSTYSKSETKPRLASIANAANEYARQQQMFGIQGLPVKRKRGRPRKYGSLSMVHSPATSRATTTGPVASHARTSMPPIPLYNNSTTSNAKAVNLQQNTSPTTISGSSVMPALSIYTPLTVGASLPGLYSAGLLLPGSTIPTTNSELSSSTGSPATWSHGDVGSTGCIVATSTSGPHSDVTEPAVTRSPGCVDACLPATKDGMSCNHPPVSVGDQAHKLTPFVPPVSRKMMETLAGWPQDRTSDLTSSSYLSLPDQGYFDSARQQNHIDLFPPSGSTHSFTGQQSDTDLMGRIVPQAGAALRASKAAGLTGPHSWTATMVSNFVATIPGCKYFASKFVDNEIDGAALLCLEQHDLMRVLGMKLGPAVKVAGAIHTLRRSLLSTPLSDLGQEYASAVAAATSCFATDEKSKTSVAESTQAQQSVSSTKDSNIPE